MLRASEVQLPLPPPDIAKIDHGVLIHDLMLHKPGITSRAASRLVVEYVRFLELKAEKADLVATELSPSSVIDEVWHLHILDTQHYMQECMAAFGAVIHHNRNGSFEAERSDRYLRTLQAYEKKFGRKAPADIWPVNEVTPRIPL